MRRPVTGWEGFYEVDETGAVWSVARVIQRSDATIQSWKGKLMKSYIGANGYLVVRLSRPGMRKTARVHRLVADAFIPNPDGFPEVNHMDGVRTNPCATNLEWCTASGNRWHAYHVLRTITMPKTGKLNPSIADAIREEHIPGACGYKRLAKKYGVNPSCVRDILKHQAYAPPPPPASEAKGASHA